MTIPSIHTQIDSPCWQKTIKHGKIRLFAVISVNIKNTGESGQQSSVVEIAQLMSLSFFCDFKGENGHTSFTSIIRHVIRTRPYKMLLNINAVMCAIRTAIITYVHRRSKRLTQFGVSNL